MIATCSLLQALPNRMVVANLATDTNLASLSNQIGGAYNPYHVSLPFIHGAEFRKSATALPAGTILLQAACSSLLSDCCIKGRTSSSCADVRGPHSGAVIPG
jgi:hypothetical protein